MKKYLALVIAAAAMCAAMMARADSDVQSEVVDGVTWYYGTGQQWNSQTQQHETYAYITSGADKYTGDLVMPGQLGGFPVKRVESAFYECTALKSVVVPEGVTYIGSAFCGCAALTNVTLPSSLTSIGSSFQNCTSLKDVVIPDSVTDCDWYAFSGCTSLTNVILSANLKNISYYMFSGCSSLKNVIIPESVTSIGDRAFSDCSSLTQIVIPTNVTSIGYYAFWGCTSLTEFNVPAAVTSIGNYFLRGCSSLTKLTVSKDNPNYKSVDNCIVSASGTTLIAIPYGCAEVVIPDGVSDIPEKMFYEDSALTKVTIPSSVTSIGNHAFYSCDSLVAVELPASLENVGNYVFSWCIALNSVLMPEGFRSIGYGMFYACTTLQQISIPSSVTSIDACAFTFCDALESVSIPECVTSIGENAFSNCSVLKNVRFLGAPPTGVENSYLLSKQNVSFPRSSGGAWMKLLNDINKFQGYNRKQPAVAVLSSQIRVNDPTILDVVYKVTSAVTNTVKVRALAFEDGVRSFAKVVRPETFVADTNGVETAGNIGDTVAANVEHTLSWKVSADWSNQLAKVTFEVLATEGDLLPLEVRTIPASEQYGKMDVTWNAISENQWFDALLWLYADKNPKVTLSNGVYYYDGKVAAKDTAIYYNKTASNYYSRTYDSDARQYVYVRYKNAPEVVLEEMGYTVLSGEVLNYVNEETRLGLSPNGARQYGYKIVSEK